jgi:very-short-patch-repair endonuclease
MLGRPDTLLATRKVSGLDAITLPMQRRRYERITNHADRGATPIKRLLARAMRKAPTEAEAVLWTVLRRRRLGVKFRRQHPVAGFVADFAALQIGLVVETDGPVHASRVEQDAARDAVLENFGLTVVRVRNADVLTNLPAVVERMSAAIRTKLVA